MHAVMVKNADRMMTTLSVIDEGLELTFADGKTGVVPFERLPEIGRASNITKVELPNPYEAIIRTSRGESVELPWDFARHYCDTSYRRRVEATGAKGRQLLGARIRRLRKDAGMTQEQLSTDAGIGRVTLVRLEQGEQSPRYETLVALSRILGRPVSDLMTLDAAMGEVGQHRRRRLRR